METVPHLFAYPLTNSPHRVTDHSPDTLKFPDNVLHSCPC